MKQAAGPGSGIEQGPAPDIGAQWQRECSEKTMRAVAEQKAGVGMRSGHAVQVAFTTAYQEAVRAYGEGDRAYRAAFAVLKQKFEKRGDHWIAKDDPAG